MAAKDSDAKQEQLSARTYAPRMRDIETIDAELRLVTALRRAARERGGPLRSIDVVDALLDERRELMGSSQGDQARGPIRCHRVGRRDASISAKERDHAVVVVVSESGY
jgi:hypothetical protein